MFAITYKNYFYACSLLLTVVSIAIFFTFGFRPSIEFTGGSLLEIQYEKDTPSVEKLRADLGGQSLTSIKSLEGVSIQQTGSSKFLMRFGEVSEQEHQEILGALPGAKELQFQSIGPVIGSELRQKTIIGLLVAVIGMFIYVAFAFRKVPAQVKSWRMSLAAIIALFHDVMIAAAAFSLFSYYYGYEAGTLFIAALLTIWGYSISDTIVVFDRIRENLLREGKRDLKEVAAMSINQTLGRSINTSLTVFLFVAVLFAMGPEPLMPFVAPLLVGIVIGTYSSIFLAAPLLLENFGRKSI